MRDVDMSMKYERTRGPKVSCQRMGSSRISAREICG